MSEFTSLPEVIQNLLSQNKEGQYWDFKRIHHQNKGELIHDVLCLANAEHDGQRYIIYGVSDEDFSVVGIDRSQARSQADILDLFSSNQSKFAFDQYPDFHLETILIDEKEVDVLIIENHFKKPYFTTQKIEGVRENFIYSRKLDRNTPQNRSAPPSDIERMWRERFGLNLSAKERAKGFLADHDNWEQYTLDNGNAGWFYKIFPEFTIKVEDAADHIDSRQEWTRGEIDENRNSPYFYTIYFHQTRLAQIHAVSFDNHKMSMVAPNWEPAMRGRLYFYEQDSLDLEMQKFHVAISGGTDHSKKLRIRLLNDRKSNGNIVPHGASTVPIPIASHASVKKFLESYDPEGSLDPIRNEKEQYIVFLKNQFAFQKWLSTQS
ncbi:ATP-binding protein [Cohaesibacter marisflavi]|uniref:ATP-binding protein n=1 Tax=Cohaesibacter marisflavi TaxID=655353 RepID=UPI000B7FDC7A|nr:ATP-binding protein [Cohaesibacter marisflavi]